MNTGASRVDKDKARSLRVTGGSGLGSLRYAGGWLTLSLAQWVVHQIQLQAFVAERGAHSHLMQPPPASCHLACVASNASPRREL